MPMEPLAFWTAVLLYAIAGVGLTVRIVFDREKLEPWAVWLAVGGALAQSAALVLRWLEVRHGPYIEFYEVMSSDALVLVALYLATQAVRPSIRPIGAIVMPIAVLMLGAGGISRPSESPIPLGTQDLWLMLHVSFAKLAYGSFFVAAALAVLLLARDSRWVRDRKLPAREALDELAYRLVTFGFLMELAMIGAGAVWAKRLWGRFWGWDPIETWALITWLGFALVLHLRRTYGWKDRRGAWLIVAMSLLVVFAFFIVPYVYTGVHTAYMRR